MWNPKGEQIEDIVGGNPSGWVAPNRVKMVEPSVGPGGTATFVFWYSTPNTMASGTYREYFELVCDGVAWIPPDLGVYWDITVP